MCVMKHVGLNVAADALMPCLCGGRGVWYLTADDPSCFPEEQDNRYYGSFSGLAVLDHLVEEARTYPPSFDFPNLSKNPLFSGPTTRINHSTAPLSGIIQERVCKRGFCQGPLIMSRSGGFQKASRQASGQSLKRCGFSEPPPKFCFR